MKHTKHNQIVIAWLLVLSSIFLFAFNDTIDKSLPAGSDDPAEADDNMRRIQGGFQELGAVEHNYDLTGTEITGTGKHTAITTTSIVNAGTLANTGDFSVNTDKFTVTASSGNTVVAGTLDVTGNIDPTAYETTNGGFLDEDTLSSDSDTKVASQQSIKAYVDSAASKAIKIFTRDMTAASGDVSYTGIGFVPTLIEIVGGVVDSPAASWGAYDGSVHNTIRQKENNDMDASTTTIVHLKTAGGAVQQTAIVKSFDADGFTLTWTKSGSPTGTANLRAICFRN